MSHAVLLEECHRYGALAELRKSFEKAWKAEWGHRAAAEAFNAWLLESLNAEDSSWPPLPGRDREADSPDGIAMDARKAVETWALLQVPSPWPFAPDLSAAQRNLEHYLQHLRALDLPGWEGGVDEAALESAEQDLNARLSDFTDPASLQAAVRRSLWPLAAAAIAPRVRRFCQVAAELAADVRGRWRRRCAESLKAPLEPLRVEQGRTKSSKVRVELQGPLPESLEGRLMRGFEIHEAHWEKLQRHFLADAGEFQPRCWAMLLRYQSLFGPHDEGAGWHMAVTPSVLSNLAIDFDVGHELFASPLNCGLPRYCSVFADTDKWFGSFGSFFSFCRPGGPLMSEGGSYECNPPFDETLIQKALAALTAALEACEKPLSVAMILPDWSVSEGVVGCVNSPHCRAQLRIVGDDHSYLNGRQHCCQPKHRTIRQTVGRGSLVLFLQNDSGAAKWPCTPERLDRHRASWCKG